MKKRWVIYLLAGLFFGAGYWHYFSITAIFFNDINSNEGAVSEGLLLIFALFTYFSVWLIPATLPAIYEFRHSRSLRFSVIAVVTVWLSAVLGYYVNYVAMLAFVGLPHIVLLFKNYANREDSARCVAKAGKVLLRQWMAADIKRMPCAVER